MFRNLFFLILLVTTYPLLGEEPFTAKVVKKKVRLRASPALEAPIVRELTTGDLIVVEGEEDGFYAVRPPREVRLYLFRTFVLDGIVEGNHVNVRLAPDLEAPVVARLNTGDTVIGEISPLHPKWMEIAVPEQVRFYVSKDFVEKVGDEHFLTLQEERFDQVKELLVFGDKKKQDLNLSFELVDLPAILEPFKQIVDDFKDFPHQLAIAEDSIKEIEQAYLLKKVAYLEEKMMTPPILEPIQEEMALTSEGQSIAPAPQLIASARAYWMDIEKNYFLKWRKENGDGEPYAYYKGQAEKAEILKGVLEPYLRPVKEKPGDFILLDKESRLPLAYLYSTRINLLDQVGKEVEIKGLIRPNNLFNHPAYFVWEIRDVPTPVIGGI